MSLPNFETANDEINTLFNVAWLARAPAMVGQVAAPPIHWDGLAKGTPPMNTTHARFFSRLFDGQQGSLGGIGNRRWRRFGVITVQVFVPLTLPAPLLLSGKLATIARDAYEGVGTDSGIWFRRVSLKQVGPDGGLYQTNVTAGFEYDEVK